jgi:hypothetical protein
VSLTSETCVITSPEHSAEEAEEETKEAKSETSSDAIKLDETVITPLKKVCASNEFEREEGRDLQEILMHKLKLNLPEVLRDEKRCKDLF